MPKIWYCIRNLYRVTVRDVLAGGAERKLDDVALCLTCTLVRASSEEEAYEYGEESAGEYQNALDGRNAAGQEVEYEQIAYQVYECGEPLEHNDIFDVTFRVDREFAFAQDLPERYFGSLGEDGRAKFLTVWEDDDEHEEPESSAGKKE